MLYAPFLSPMTQPSKVLPLYRRTTGYGTGLLAASVTLPETWKVPRPLYAAQKS